MFLDSRYMLAITPDLSGLLQKHFGYSAFRPLQEEIIKTVLDGKDCLTVMPTGSGKSLCFQLPALCLPGITLVISPLIALMKDQVDGLQADGVAAAFLNSSQTSQDQARIMDDARAGRLKLLYIAPERLSVGNFRAFLSSIPLSLIAIDEAHCLSEWGHEFRPDYRLLAELRTLFPRCPCIALTATATPQVQDDIRAQLKLSDAPLFLSSFNRENLTYHVYPKERSFERLVMTLRKNGRLPAIIYCFSRKDTEMLAIDLKAEGFSCLPYHAGLEQEVRSKAQERFMRDEVQVITATIAFGMGIDKPDVRTVVHMDLPKTMEGYYQETGRAGRDGLPSDCILFYSHADTFKHEYFIRQIEDASQQRIARAKMEAMTAYAEIRSCRRRSLLRYFDEHFAPESCNSCDRCLVQEELFDATQIAQKILCGVIKTGERFGGAHVADVLKGKNTARIRALGHMQLSVFGIVQDFSDQQIKDLIGHLIAKGYLLKATGLYSTLSVTPQGHALLASQEKLLLPKLPEALIFAEQARQTDIAFDPMLFEELRTLRRSIAERQKVAAFIIFGDRSLREMAAYFPQTPQKFQQIYGVSDQKLAQYGEAFLGVIRRFAAAHGHGEQEIPRPIRERHQERLVQEKGSTYGETLQLVRQKHALSDIARKRGLKESTIVQHLEALASVHTDLSIEHLKPSPEVFSEISAAFTLHGSEALSPVFTHFEGKFSYDILRLVRLFLKSQPVS
jgi:ATP-dependent DNA helicase RecQ